MRRQGKKVLVIRLNSIGDIVLTGPVVEKLHSAGFKVHYLVKAAFSAIPASNPFVSKTWIYGDNPGNLTECLRNENFDYTVDLHNNLRSLIVRRRLQCPALVFKKDRFNDILITRWNFARKQRQHIIYRFLDTIEPLTGSCSNPHFQYYFPEGKSYSHIELPGKDYMCIAVATAHKTKDIPLTSLSALIDKVKIPVVLLGSTKDKAAAQYILSNTNPTHTIDMTGKLSIDESAYCLSKSRLLLTGDTGLMHIAASLSVPTVSVFGSTHPMLGYTPFYTNSGTKSEIVENNDLDCRPCTRQGRESCPLGHFRCMNGISVDELMNKVEGILNS